MTEDPVRDRMFLVNEESREVIWAVGAAARVILRHPVIESGQVMAIGAILRAMELLPRITMQEPITIGLKIENSDNDGAPSGVYLQITADPNRFEISRTWMEYDPAIGGDHSAAILCECESSGFSASQTDLLLLPHEFERMLEEEPTIFLETQ